MRKKLKTARSLNTYGSVSVLECFIDFFLKCCTARHDIISLNLMSFSVFFFGGGGVVSLRKLILFFERLKIFCLCFEDQSGLVGVLVSCHMNIPTYEPTLIHKYVELVFI